MTGLIVEVRAEAPTKTKGVELKLFTELPILMNARVSGVVNNEASSRMDSRLHLKVSDLASLVRPFTFRWSMLAVCAFVDLIWLLAEGWTIKPASLLPRAMLGIIFCTPLLIKRYRRDVKLRSLGEAVAFSLIFATAGEILSYMVVSTDLPLIDAYLAIADKTVGFNWGRYYLWAASHPDFSHTVRTAYESMGLQLGIVLIFLSFTQRKSKLSEFLDLSSSLLVVTLAVSLFFPAEGASKFYTSQYHADVSGMTHFELLRSGTLRAIDLGLIQGLISIPSYHTIMGILLCWSVRGSRLCPILIVVNSAMLLATPFVGGHYFVDLIAGAAVTFVGIMLRRFLCTNWGALSDRRRLAETQMVHNM